MSSMSSSVVSAQQHVPLFKQRYLDAREGLAKLLGVSNPHMIPKLGKIVLHARYGQFLTDNVKKRFVKDAICKIAGRRPCDINAKKSVSQFKIREGALCGCMATLRGDRMYEFLGRLLIALPRMRSFEGLSRRGADGNGNFNFGVEDHASFLEVQNMVDFRCGFDVLISTTASSNEGVLAMIEAIGFPLTNARKSKKGKKSRKK